MKGLRTQEDDNFVRFFKKVQEVASEQGKAFFLDFGEGKEFSFDGMLVDGLCGWLVPLNKADTFNQDFLKFKPLDDWDDEIFWCEPSIENNELKIVFSQYDFELI